MTDIEQLIKKLKKYKLSDNIRYKLLQIDSFSNNLEYKDKLDFIGDNNQLKTTIFLPYIIEKFIVYSNDNGKNNIENNALIKIFNISNHLGGNISDNLTYEKLSFLLDKEQIRFQDNNYNILRYRYLTLFKDNKISVKIINHILKMDLDKFIFLSYVLCVYISTFKKVKIELDIDSFKEYILAGINNNISEQNIDEFLEYISLKKDEFIQKYNALRKDENGKSLSNNIINKSDRYLPKVSFFYPLIKEDNEYYFTSYTAIIEFLKFERIFTEISENKDINSHYRDNILGKILIENYVKNEAKYFNNNLSKVNGKIYGGAEYNLKINSEVREKKYDEPDLIFEFDDYIIFVECKNSISHLIHTINNFNSAELKKRIKKDLDTSIKNINRFLDYKPKLKTKKHYKFLMYFNATPISTNKLQFNLFQGNDIFLTDISSIELLFRIRNNNLNDVLKSYQEAKDKHSLYDFIKNNYEIDNTKEDKILEYYKNYFQTHQRY